jgi:prepilin-type N-terminal cleavage/methylation domain-containing protein
MKLMNDQDGFTLVEVLVSLALLSVLSVYALSAFRVQKDMDHMSSDIARKIEVRAALDVLRHQLQGMQLVFVPGQVESRSLIFEGHRDNIAFAGLSDGSRIEGGLYRMRFSIDDKHALVAGFEPIKASGFGAASSIVVLDNVESITFVYRATMPKAPSFDEWPKQDELPRTIDVKLRLQDELEKQAIETLIEVELAW